jgi:hypothetical protein
VIWILLITMYGFLPSAGLFKEIKESAETLGCILDWPKVRNTRFKHSDPEKVEGGDADSSGQRAGQGVSGGHHPLANSV